MANMNKRNRDKTLMWFQSVPRYFNKTTQHYICQGCGASFSTDKICVDHKDNNNNNNHHRNLQPLCRSCNVIKNKKDPMKKPKHSRRVDYNATAIPETIKRSDRIKFATIKYLEEYVKGDERKHIKDAIEWICYEANAEQQAVLRAIEVQTGSHPDCRWMRFTDIDDGDVSNVFIQLKPEYQKKTS